VTPTALIRGDLPDRFTVYALEWGQRTGVRGEHFLGWDQASGDRHDVAYYAWLLLSADRTVLVDSGADPNADSTLPGWTFRSSITDILQTVGVAAADIDTVVLTHLHYDHAGGARLLPRARVQMQQAELAYWTGPNARRIAREAWLVDQRDVAHLMRLVDCGRATLTAGDVEVGHGLSAHSVGGHTAGTQIVAVQTGTGRLVLASDAVQFFENLDADRPGTIVHSMPAVFSAFDRARDLASGGMVVPGHDPGVLTRFRSPDDRLPDHVVRLA
jgi:glyoxylase-like metal-dependent hydrolase (beta-lactamase superfamily II)